MNIRVRPTLRDLSRQEREAYEALQTVLDAPVTSSVRDEARQAWYDSMARVCARVEEEVAE